MKRRIIEIDQEKCNGCGICADACHEGAIGMIDGKATLLRDDYCDGLGDCLPTCPTGAITFIEKDTVPYDEAAVKANMAKKAAAAATTADHSNSAKTADPALHAASGASAAEFHGCPGSRSMAIHRNADNQAAHASSDMGSAASMSGAPASGNAAGSGSAQTCQPQQSQLSNWPVQIKLAPFRAPYFENANLLVAADCTAYAYADFHRDFIRNRVTLIGCPKLDAIDYTEKLTEIIAQNDIKSLTILRMEVPCCGGLEMAAKTALKNSGKFIPWNVVTISIDGKILD